MKNFSLPQPPRGKLSQEARRWWRHFVSAWEFDEAGLLILASALEAFDRMRQAQKILTDEGLVIQDRFGQKKCHPAALIERDARAGMLRALKQLNLDLEPLQEGVGRPLK